MDAESQLRRLRKNVEEQSQQIERPTGASLLWLWVRGFRVGFRIVGSGLRVYGMGFWGLGLKGLGLSGFGLRVWSWV